MQRTALTTWSIHPYLSDGSLDLMAMPARVKAAGIATVEICHFHIPNTEIVYLQSLKTAAANAGVEIFSILIDAFDISQADNAADIAQVQHWMDTAALQRTISALKALQAYATPKGVRVMSENFKTMASTPANWLAIHQALGYGGCADIGNFANDSRVSDFGQVAAMAASIHVKASYDDQGQLLPAQVNACLATARKHGFSGPTTLVYDRPGDRWPHIEALRQLVTTAFV
ncbi:MAG: hypothetical protein NT020_09330 [Chloroflexales bacterium]|nr:hypothetical protein [Chloroflexales bacterium]